MLCFNCGHRIRENEKTGTEIQSLIDKRMIIYDPLLHEDIRRKIEERKWIKLEPPYSH